MDNIVDGPAKNTKTRRQKIVAVAALLGLVVLSQLCMITYRHFSSSVQATASNWGRLRCIDHGRTWVPSDKTQTAGGSCE